MDITIDCGTCSRHATSYCDDCVVSFILNRRPDDAVVVDAAEFAAVRRLQRAGMLPELRHDGGVGHTG